jgi:glycosyltransferase involved in cell wall biosynthesis
MMYGLPLITTDEGGIPEVVENNKTGFIIEKENSKLLVEKIEILIKNESLRIQLGQNGRKKFLNEYTLAHFENNLSNILSSLS